MGAQIAHGSPEDKQPSLHRLKSLMGRGTLADYILVAIGMFVRSEVSKGVQGAKRTFKDSQQKPRVTPN